MSSIFIHPLRCLFFLFLFSSSIAYAKPKEYACCIYRLPLPDLPHGEIAFINGINHRPERALRCSSLISKLAGGYNIYTIYNPTDGLLGDLKKCYHELFKFKKTVPVEKLQEKWDLFFLNAKEGERFLQICHSEGAIQVRNALTGYPETLRKRIIVIAIAPGAYIPPSYCYKAYHYISRRDIVPYFDRMGIRTCIDTICVLTPHERAAFFDHHFLSLTYRDIIQYHIQEYIQSGARRCE